MKRAAVFAVLSVAVAYITSSSAFGQVPFKVTKLIGDLNDTVETNKAARKQLVEMGHQAVPGLLEEIKKYSDLQNAGLISAARCLRVLREMNSDAAVDVAIEMLATLNPKWEPGQLQHVLLSEAVYYLSDNFQNAKARAAFYRFVKGSAEKWRQGTAWTHGTPRDNDGHSPFVAGARCLLGSLGSTRYAWIKIGSDTVVINIFYGLEKLVDRKDAEIGGVLTDILGQLPYRFSVFVEYVSASDGFTPNTYVYGYEGEKTADFSGGAKELVFEPKARPRMLVMRWLRDLGYRQGAQGIEPLLRSSQKDERDFALTVLEQLAGRGPAGTPATQVEEPQPDVVQLRNGDVLTGDITNATLTIKTSYADLTFKRPEIASIQVQTAASRTDLMELRVGDKLSGILQDAEIKMRLKAGGETTIKKADIDNIRFGQRPAVPEPETKPAKPE